MLSLHQTKNGDNIWWVFSDAVVPVRNTQETVNNILKIKTNNPMYQVVLYAIAMYYQGMINLGINLPISDATIPILLLYPHLATNVVKESIDIDDGVFHTYTENVNEIISTATYSKQVGSMILGDYTTNLVMGVNNTDGQMIQAFYQMLTRNFKLPVYPIPPIIIKPPFIPPSNNNHGIVGVTLVDSTINANIVSTTINGKTTVQTDYTLN